MDDHDNEFTQPSSEGTDGTPEGVPTDRRPLGYWLRTVDGLISKAFHDAFEGTGATRRDWMLLNALSGDGEVPAFAARFVRKGKRLRTLADRGWAEETGDGTWVLTDEGRAAKDRFGAIVDGIRARVAGAVSPEDLATTLASLEAIARELGWEEGMRPSRGGFGRGRRHGRGFGPGAGRGFGPGFGSGFGPGYAPGFAHWMDDEGRGFGPGRHHGRPSGEHCGHGANHGHGENHGHPEHHGHGRHGSGRSSERAYERGFEAGFSRGRSAEQRAENA